MSQRERWIVYPLLFLAVTLAGFDKIFGSGKLNFDEVVCNRLKAKEIYCAEMQTVSIDGTQKLLRIGATPEGGGELLLYHFKRNLNEVAQFEPPQPKVMLRARENGGELRTASVQCSEVVVTDDGQRSLVQINGNAWGGVVSARSRDGAWGVALGHIGPPISPEDIAISGMFGIDMQAHPIVDDEGRLWGLQFARPAHIVPRSLPESPAQESPSDAEATEGSPPTEEATTESESPQSEAEATQGDAGESEPAPVDSTDDSTEDEPTAATRPAENTGRIVAVN